MVTEYLASFDAKYIALPFYSTELNLIKLLWAWLKQQLQRTPLNFNLYKSISSNKNMCVNVIFLLNILSKMTLLQVISLYASCEYI